jgi:hypothetical protein
MNDVPSIYAGQAPMLLLIKKGQALSERPIMYTPGKQPDVEGAKHATFCAICIQKRPFYQDRLGTNIGKALKKEWLRFPYVGMTEWLQSQGVELSTTGVAAAGGGEGDKPEPAAAAEGAVDDGGSSKKKKKKKKGKKSGKQDL